VRQHEPRQALVAGLRGAEVIERLVPAAALRLHPGGWLILEISPMIHAATEKLIAADAHFELGPIVKDIAGHARVVQAQRKNVGS
jgi:release factor glutamine methyltransferase